MAKAAPRGANSGAHRVASAPPPRGRGVPFLLGICCGIALTLLFTRSDAVNLKTLATPQAGVVETPPEVRFEFPDVLRDAEVLVPYVEEYLDGEAKPEAGAAYLLQAGAFRSPQDADRRRAMILLQDLPARTAEVSRDGGTWHRVLVGPFDSRRAARSAQLALLREDIDSLVLRSEP